MILPRELIRAIKEGRKTRITRPRAPHGPRGAGWKVERPPWEIGGSYPVQQRVLRTVRNDRRGDRQVEGRETRLHVIVTAIVQADLSLAEYRDARAEGFATTDELFDWWRDHHGHRPRLVLGDGSIVEIRTPVWVALIEPDERWFLVEHDAHKDPASQGDESGRGYVHTPSLALVEEGQAVDSKTLERYAKQNATAGAGRERERRERWQRMTLRERAEEIERLGPLAGVDVSRELRTAAKALEKALEKIDRHQRAA